MNVPSGGNELPAQKSIKTIYPQNHSLNRDAFSGWYLPVLTFDRKNIHTIQLTTIGGFGAERLPRPGIPAHLHTGIDIMRPSGNFTDESVFPAAVGEVISVRDDGPFAQIIIAHQVGDGVKVWTVYEHVAEIVVAPGDHVDPFFHIARFMNQEELNQYGWQFNHLHFEVMKTDPLPVAPTAEHPNRFFATCWMDCRSYERLKEKYYDPMRLYGESAED